MKVLFVCSYRPYMKSGVAAFIEDQSDALSSIGVVVDYFLVRGKGVKGYLKNFPKLRDKIIEYKPDIIHAHYGLCGLLANLQRRVPVVTTYHGSDINNGLNLILSKWSILLSSWNIFVSAKMADRVRPEKAYSIIPCGVNTDLFFPMDKHRCRNVLGWSHDVKYALFSKEFGDTVKNYPLAKAAIDRMDGWQLVELIGYTHEQVAILMNACDVALMTSFSEGSPQFIKEALACGVPIVSTDVGDVADVINGVRNAKLCSYDADDVCEKIKEADAVGHLDGRCEERFDNHIIVRTIMDIYSIVLK